MAQTQTPRNTRITTALFALASIGLLAGLGAATAPLGSGDWQGAGTVVTNFSLGTAGFQGSITILDNGAVVCEDTDGDGIPDAGQGGVCIRFADLQGDSIYVHDDSVADQDLAFQVCIDNNGDGICGGPQVDPCKDRIFFSHETQTGNNHNPLLVPVQDFPAGCDSGQFPGYVVITCAGVHSHGTVATTHTHEANSGTAKSTVGGTGFGDFCGAPTAAKAYVVL